jgi:hypothetical protein
MGIFMKRVDELFEELDLLEAGRSEYTWDEWEEIITNDLDDEKIYPEEFDELMQRLHEIDCDA